MTSRSQTPSIILDPNHLSPGLFFTAYTQQRPDLLAQRPPVNGKVTQTWARWFSSTVAAFFSALCSCWCWGSRKVVKVDYKGYAMPHLIKQIDGTFFTLDTIDQLVDQLKLSSPRFE